MASDLPIVLLLYLWWKHQNRASALLDADMGKISESMIFRLTQFKSEFDQQIIREAASKCPSLSWDHSFPFLGFKDYYRFMNLVQGPC